jgi:hypothetical protein
LETGEIGDADFHHRMHSKSENDRSNLCSTIGNLALRTKPDQNRGASIGGRGCCADHVGHGSAPFAPLDESHAWRQLP